MSSTSSGLSTCLTSTWRPDNAPSHSVRCSFFRSAHPLARSLYPQKCTFSAASLHVRATCSLRTFAPPPLCIHSSSCSSPNLPRMQSCARERLADVGRESGGSRCRAEARREERERRACAAEAAVGDHRGGQLTTSPSSDAMCDMGCCVVVWLRSLSLRT